MILWTLLTVATLAIVDSGRISAQEADFSARLIVPLTPTFFANPVEWSVRDDSQLFVEAVHVSGIGGLYIAEAPNGVRALLQGGDEAPELPGLVLATGPAGPWVGGNTGYVSSVALAGSGVTADNDVAVYTDSGSLGALPQLLFREGDPVPGLPGATFTFGIQNVSFGRGKVFFEATLDDPGGDPQALFYGEPGDLMLVARVGEPAPGRPGEDFADFLDSSLATNDFGVVTFLARTTVGAIGLWIGPPDAVVLRAFEGEPAFGTSEVISDLSALRPMSLTATTQQAVLVGLSGAVDAIFTDVPQSPRLAVETIFGQTSDGTSIQGDIDGMSVSPSGLVAATTDAPLGSDLLVAERRVGPGQVELVRVGEGNEQAPGLPGVQFSDFLGDPIINQFEQVAFWARLEGPGIDSSNDDSFWIYDPELGLEIVAREGSTVDLLGDVRTLASLSASFRGSLQDGWQRPFNGRGELVYQAVFTDSSAALVVSQVESPQILFIDGFESGDTSRWSSAIP